MKYDFTTIMDPQGKDSIAADVIPTPEALNYPMRILKES